MQPFRVRLAVEPTVDLVTRVPDEIAEAIFVQPADLLARCAARDWYPLLTVVLNLPQPSLDHRSGTVKRSLPKRRQAWRLRERADATIAQLSGVLEREVDVLVGAFGAFGAGCAGVGWVTPSG